MEDQDAVRPEEYGYILFNYKVIGHVCIDCDFDTSGAGTLCLIMQLSPTRPNLLAPS